MAINQSSLDLLRKQHDLAESAAYDIAIELLNGNCTTPEIVEVLQLLQQKGESVSEIIGFIKAMRANMTPLSFSQQPLIDICGTGGSLPNRFNVSTCVALVLGKLGYSVAKHGNRGSKKANGSFDFLDELGIPYELTEAEHQARLDKFGSTFLFIAARLIPAAFSITLDPCTLATFISTPDSFAAGTNTSLRSKNLGKKFTAPTIFPSS